MLSTDLPPFRWWVGDGSAKVRPPLSGPPRRESVDSVPSIQQTDACFHLVTTTRQS